MVSLTTLKGGKNYEYILKIKNWSGLNCSVEFKTIQKAGASVQVSTRSLEGGEESIKRFVFLLKDFNWKRVCLLPMTCKNCNPGPWGFAYLSTGGAFTGQDFEGPRGRCPPEPLAKIWEMKSRLVAAIDSSSQAQVSASSRKPISCFSCILKANTCFSARRQKCPPHSASVWGQPSPVTFCSTHTWYVWLYM